jgi:hypothetical protein
VTSTSLRRPWEVGRRVEGWIEVEEGPLVCWRFSWVSVWVSPVDSWAVRRLASSESIYATLELLVAVSSYAIVPSRKWGNAHMFIDIHDLRRMSHEAIRDAFEGVRGSLC